jgi:hypothetical protein
VASLVGNPAPPRPLATALVGWAADEPGGAISAAEFVDSGFPEDFWRAWARVDLRDK